jgi:transposase-like protein
MNLADALLAARRFSGAAVFLTKIIPQCVWLYFNVCVSLQDVELVMALRGVCS